MIQRLFGDKAPYQLVKILRYLGFTILCLLLCVGFITEIIIGLNSLYLIPFIFIALSFEHKIYQRIEYYYGKFARQSAMYLYDVFLCSLFIAAIHALLIPSFILICAMILRLFIFLQFYSSDLNHTCNRQVVNSMFYQYFSL